MQGEEILLEVSHVNKEFPVKKQRLHAVSDVSFALHKGELLGIVGESGCGKSTLAKMLVGSLPVSSGKMELSGVDYAALKGKERRAFRRKIQMVFQDPLSSFSPRMKIGTYLAEPRRNYDKVSKQQAFAEAEQLLEKVGLPRDFLVRYPHELSGGQLQRVAIARALAIHPELLICDEATGALDVSIQNQIAKLLVELVREQNMGCIFIGHDLALVRSVTQRIAVMYLGRIVELLDSEDLEVSCRHPYTKALLRAVPRLDTEEEQSLESIEGTPPNMIDPPAGCAFSTRCAQCMRICQKSEPPMFEFEDGHTAQCWLYHPMAAQGNEE